MPAEPLARRLNALPPSPFGAAALDRLKDAAGRQSAGDRLDALLADGDLAAFLASSLGDCPYLLDLAVRDITRFAGILDGDPETLVAAIGAELGAGVWATRPEVMATLRRAKQTVALTVGLADLGGAIALDTVTRLLSDFADAALSAALRFALAEAERQGKWKGEPNTSGFFVLAMGKYGAGELNYSSDIDLITLFDPEGPGLPADAEPSVFWVRIVKAIVALLQERTAEGYVFRVDLRLRPDPAATAVAISSPAALVYYESMGQNWERAALVKARPCAGDVAAGARFLREITPFIWRRHLDFAAIADIHSIKRQVHAHRGHAKVQVLGHDIKRGRGGIREIEFFVQTQQLIAGGRDRTLRGRETRPMLAALARRGWIGENVSAALDEAYVYLRTVEHRLQMVRDEQTHTMPSDAGDLARIARLMGQADPAAFEAELRGVLDGVARRYSELFESSPDLSGEAGSLVFTGGEDDPDTLETLRGLGFRDPAGVTQAVRAWHFGRFAATRSTAAREALTELTPALLRALAAGGNPDAGLRAFDALLQALPAGAQLFSLLARNGRLLSTLTAVLAAAPRLAEAFGRRPHIVDALIDPASLAQSGGGTPPSVQIEETLDQAVGHEDALNRARRFAAEQRFLVSVRFLTGTLGAEAAGVAFSDVAAAVVDALFHRTLAEFERQYGRVPGGKAAVLAFGRLGSREMTASSDLDLIVIYDHDAEASGSDGKRPLAPSQYYARLTQRLTAALASPTADGIAYAVDLRLRPSGQKGPLATHLRSFTLYQLEEAWTWEHMAVARGRGIAGDTEIRAAAAAVIEQAVGKPRDRKVLAQDVASMRQRVDDANPKLGIFDLKLALGGIMDCDFAAQFLILAGLGRVEGEPVAETLRRAGAVGGLDPVLSDTLVRSSLLQSALLHAIRIAGETSLDPGAAPEGLRRLLVSAAEKALGVSIAEDAPPAREEAAQSGGDGWDALQRLLVETQQRTRAALKTILQEAGADWEARR